jgi:DNA-binding protein
MEVLKVTDKNDGIVFIGGKPFMNYVTSVIMQLSHSKEILLKARGKYISKAVDVAQVSTRRLIKDAKVSKVTIDSQEFDNRNKQQIRVSTIEIAIQKK